MMKLWSIVFSSIVIFTVISSIRLGIEGFVPFPKNKWILRWDFRSGYCVGGRFLAFLDTG